MVFGTKLKEFSAVSMHLDREGNVEILRQASE
jgi:hypothetical protein